MTFEELDRSKKKKSRKLRNSIRGFLKLVDSKVDKFKLIFESLNKIFIPKINDIKQFNQNKIKIINLIDEYFKNFSIYNYTKANTYDLISIINLLLYFLTRKFKVIEFFITYCFEKHYFNKKCKKFQLFLACFGKTISHLGLRNEEQVQTYEWLLINVFHPDLIKKCHIHEFSVEFYKWKRGLVHLMFTEHFTVDEKFYFVSKNI